MEDKEWDGICGGLHVSANGHYWVWISVEFLRKLVLEFPSRRDILKLAAALGFKEKMGGLAFESDFLSPTK